MMTMMMASSIMQSFFVFGCGEFGNESKNVVQRTTAGFDGAAFLLSANNKNVANVNCIDLSKKFNFRFFAFGLL